MQITRINANLNKTQLPTTLNQSPTQEIDRFEPVKPETPFWRQCLNHGLATGGMTAAASVPGIVFGSQGALAADGGG